MTEEELLPFCECGECGLRVTKKGNRFIHGHNKNRLGKKNSPEHNAAVSNGMKNSDAVKAYADARRGVPLSLEHIATLTGRIRTPETCAKMSESHTGVPLTPKHIAALSTAAEAFRGGNDICDHHIAYDFSRPEALTVKITRSFHGQIHHPKGCKFGTYGYSLID